MDSTATGTMLLDGEVETLIMNSNRPNLNCGNIYSEPRGLRNRGQECMGDRSAINVLQNIHQGNKCRSTMPPVSISWKCSAEEGAVGDDDAPIDEGIVGHLFLQDGGVPLESKAQTSHM